MVGLSVIQLSKEDMLVIQQFQIQLTLKAHQHYLGMQFLGVPFIFILILTEVLAQMLHCHQHNIGTSVGI